MILNRQRRVPVSLGPLADFLERARAALHFPEDAVTVRLVSDPAMAHLNRTYRGKLGATDVLSFPANESALAGTGKASSDASALSRRARYSRVPKRNRESAPGDIYIGDIAISPETARRNALRFSRRLPAELCILILHGMIHLAGYDHETDDGQMNRLERRLRRRFGLPWP